MSTGWFIFQYVVKANPQSPRFPWVRWPEINDFDPDLRAENGRKGFVEVLGNVGICKVVASDALLATIAGTSGFQRIPVGARLSDPLTSLTTTQRNAVLNRLQAMGYGVQEITDALGGNLAAWRTKTLGDLLRFIAKRRLKPLSIDENGVEFSTVEVTPDSVDTLDTEVN